MHPWEIRNVSFTDVLQFGGHLIQSNNTNPNSCFHTNPILVPDFPLVY